MASKQELKVSEARILLYLSQVNNTSKNVANISTKLSIGYSYLSNLLRDMVSKRWVFKHSLQTKMFYDLTVDGKALLKKARRVVADE